MFRSFLRALLHPVTIGSFLFVWGGLLAQTDSVWNALFERVYALWTKEAAPYVVQMVFVAFLTCLGIYRGWVIGSRWHSWIMNREETDRPERELAGQISIANQRREEAEFQEWITGRLTPWHRFLDSIGLPKQFKEVEDSFRGNRVGGTRVDEMRYQDVWMMEWLVEKSVSLAADREAHGKKINHLLRHAFRISGERGIWSEMSLLPGSETVLPSFFLAQINELTHQYGGARDVNGGFAAFNAWAISSMWVDALSKQEDLERETTKVPGSLESQAEIERRLGIGAPQEP